MVARLGGWLGRKCDAEPGAESLQAGLRILMCLVWGWRLAFSSVHQSEQGCIYYVKQSKCV